MKLSEMVSEDLILPSLQTTTISGVLREFADAICAAGKFNNPVLLFERLLEREKQESTGIGNEVAIPHCKLNGLAESILSVGYSEEGVDFHALDGQPTYFFFVVVSPTGSSVLHLRSLAALSRLLRSPHFVSQLRQRPGKKELIELIRQDEQEAKIS